jgi:peroxiredoxin
MWIERSGPSTKSSAPGESYPEYPMRHSYLIDPDGRIHRRYEVTDVASHAADVIRDLEAAQTEP